MNLINVIAKKNEFRKWNHFIIGFAGTLCLWVLSGCSATKYVPQGSFLLSKMTVTVQGKEVKADELTSYVKQQPNPKTLGLFPMSLNIYSLSGRDTTKSFNRFLRRLGRPPVIYDSTQTSFSEAELQKAMRNRGYFRAEVEASTRFKKKRVEVVYTVKPDTCYRIVNYSVEVQDSALQSIVDRAKENRSLITKKAPLAQSLLEQERDNLATLFRNRGYYKFSKSNLYYFADSLKYARPMEVDLSLRINPTLVDSVSNRYKIRNIYIHTNYDPIENVLDQQKPDTILYKGYHIITTPKRWINQSLLAEHCLLRPDSYYSDWATQLTFNGYNRLSAIKYTAIRYDEVGRSEDHLLDCNIYVSQAKNKVFSTEVEGTNSAGDLGAAVNVKFQHLNIFKGSEIFGVRVRGAYEYLANLGSASYFLEVGGETSLSFPRFIFPFLNADFKKRINAVSEANLNLNFQRRPEYTRVVAGAGWKYKWSRRDRIRHTWDLIDLSYTYLPYRSPEFIKSIESNDLDPIVKQSYEDMFILKTAYNYYLSNATSNGTVNRNKDIYTLRLNGELAGNVLYGLSKLVNAPQLPDGGYNIFGIRFAQYIKGVVDYTHKVKIDDRNEIAYHASLGVAYPYGNLTIVPFERRFFSGGANSLRGWSVRTLGPGTYRSQNTMTDYINQSGDIKLDLNFEYRTNLVWLLQLALFADAGNIWTIRDYPNQPGGMFRWDSFYKEIAMNYGIGLRFDFSFLVFRLDWGIKLYDPSRTGSEKWRFSGLNLNTDSTLHFAIGYPF